MASLFLAMICVPRVTHKVPLSRGSLPWPALLRGSLIVTAHLLCNPFAAPLTTSSGISAALSVPKNSPDIVEQSVVLGHDLLQHLGCDRRSCEPLGKPFWLPLVPISCLLVLPSLPCSYRRGVSYPGRARLAPASQ